MEQIEFIRRWTSQLKHLMESVGLIHTNAQAGEAAARLLVLAFDICAKHMSELTIIRLSQVTRVLGRLGFEYIESTPATFGDDEQVYVKLEIWKRIENELVFEQNIHIPVHVENDIPSLSLKQARASIASLVRDHVKDYSVGIAQILFGDEFYKHVASRQTIMMRFMKQTGGDRCFQSATLDQQSRLDAFNNVVAVDHRTVDMARDHLFAIAESYSDMLSDLAVRTGGNQ